MLLLRTRFRGTSQFVGGNSALHGDLHELGRQGGNSHSTDAHLFARAHSRGHRLIDCGWAEFHNSTQPRQEFLATGPSPPTLGQIVLVLGPQGMVVPL